MALLLSPWNLRVNDGCRASMICRLTRGILKLWSSTSWVRNILVNLFNLQDWVWWEPRIWILRCPQVIPMHTTLCGPQPCRSEADAWWLTSTTSHWLLEASSEQMLKDPSGNNAGPESGLHVCTPCTADCQVTLLWMGVAAKMKRDNSCPVRPTVQSYNLNEPGLPSLRQHLLFIFLFIPKIFYEYCVFQNLFYDKQGGWGPPPAR